MPWQCSACAAVNRDVARFCGSCGSPRHSPESVCETQSVSKLTIAASPELTRYPVRTGYLGGLGAPSGRHTVLHEQYQVVREIARGGQGVMYEAVDLLTNDRVAIKTLRMEAIANPQNYPQAVARIRNEALLLAMLRHPNIVQVLALFEENGAPHIVMEYLDGLTLARITANAGGRLPVAEAVDYARQICAALAYMHAHAPPIIYRDVKPDNVMASRSFAAVVNTGAEPRLSIPSGRSVAKLIDFGLARKYRAGAHGDTSVFGSLGYAPPEQYGAAQTDARSDVFALGVTLLVLLTGYNPATNTNIAGQLPRARSLNSLLSGDIEEIIVRATQPYPEDRWQSARAFDLALSALNL